MYADFISLFYLWFHANIWKLIMMQYFYQIPE